MSDRIDVNHERVAAQVAQADAWVTALRKDRDRMRRREVIADAIREAIYAAQWMILGVILVLGSVVQSSAVNLAVAWMRPCIDDSGINCSVTAPNGTQFASVHIGNHLIIMVHNDK